MTKFLHDNFRIQASLIAGLLAVVALHQLAKAKVIDYKNISSIEIFTSFCLRDPITFTEYNKDAAENGWRLMSDRESQKYEKKYTIGITHFWEVKPDVSISFGLYPSARNQAKKINPTSRIKTFNRNGIETTNYQPRVLVCTMHFKTASDTNRKNIDAITMALQQQGLNIELPHSSSFSISDNENGRRKKPDVENLGWTILSNSTSGTYPKNGLRQVIMSIPHQPDSSQAKKWGVSNGYTRIRSRRASD